ncbi:MAG: hypothetical protein HY097_08560 [Nitrospinae bacterium]|nr:hypothetical protein [Nitrospinota bacterium]
MDFPTQLTVTAGNDVNIIFVNERGGVVSVYGNLPDTVTWAQEGNIVAAFSPGVPSKKIQFTLTASTASNIITLLLDSSGNLFGGTCYRPGVDSGEGTTAINGSFMKGGSLSAVSNSGNTATFDVSFWRGDNSINSYYQITGNYDCGTSTSGTYSSLAVTAVGGTSSGDYLTEGYTLTTTGPITCGNISQ